METAKVQIKGIARQLSLNSIPDGYCDELINLRHDNGRLEPVGAKTKVYDLPTGTFEAIWIHELDDTTNYVGLTDSYQLKLINMADSSSAWIKTYTGSVQVEFIKRFMIVVHDNGMDVFSWKDTAYELIELPDRPRLKLFTSDVLPFTCDSGTDAEEILGQYYEKVNEVSNDNYHTGGFMFRAAIRMFDGSYVLHSIPEFLELALDMSLVDNSGSAIKFRAAKVSFSLLPSLFSSINTDIFTHIVIFASKNEELYDVHGDVLDDDMLASAGTSYPIDFKDMFTEVNPDFKKFSDTPSWYNIHEIVISEVKDQSAVVTEEIDLTGFYQDYATREVLPIDQFSHHVLTGGVSYDFNSRLHLGKVSTKLGGYEYYPLNPSSPAGLLDSGFKPTGFTFEENLPVNLLVTLNTDNGEKDLLIDVGDRPAFSSGSIHHNNSDRFVTIANSVVGYPDARATSIAILVQKSGIWYKIRSITLKKSVNGNYSYYNPELFSVEPWKAEIEASFTQDGYNYQYIFCGTSFPASQQFDISSYSETVLLRDNNRVQVSEVNNPLYFAAENSYQVGKGEVIGFAANTVPLSEGQFGQHPLQVFTSKGVWAMVQGSGDVLYSNIIPTSGHVASAGSIISIGKGVAYTTSKGIFTLAGNVATELTALLKGSPNTDFQANANYQFYLDDVRLVVELDNKLSTVNVLSYTIVANMGYDQENNELIVSNSASTYSYVYNFDSGSWHKVDESYSLLINYYPKLYALKESGTVTGVINLSDEVYTDAIQVLITTQPLKLNAGDNFKLIHRTILRTLFTQETGTHAGFYLFGSSDLENWQRLKGTNHLDGKKRDILLTRIGSKFKYFIAVFAGKISCDSYIDSIDFQFIRKLGNKLR